MEKLIKKTASETINERIANSILVLVKEHKKSCKNPDCGVSLYLMKDVYEYYKDRKINKKEVKYFL